MSVASLFMIQGNVDPQYRRKLHMEVLAALAERILLSGLRSGSYDLLQGTVQMYAARSIALGEALITELMKVNQGQELVEETNVAQGTLFAMFRGEGTK